MSLIEESQEWLFQQGVRMKFEYTAAHGVPEHEAEHIMNQYGEDGWVVVGMRDHNDRFDHSRRDKMIIYFQRRKA